MSVYDIDRHPFLLQEIRLIQEAIALDMGVLGICLGAQLLSKALGGKVFPAKQAEIGWYPVKPTSVGRNDPLFEHFNDEEFVFQWHSDTFSLPAGAELLVSAPDCPNQAFRFGKKVYGFQFHMEVDDALNFAMVEPRKSSPGT